MIAVFICVCLLVCPALIFSEEEKALPCVTPNGENAFCVLLDSCKVIKDAIATGDETARKFARDSECKTGRVPFVCCGSTALPIQEMSKLPHKSQCGFQITDERVFGGQLTEIGEFPWIGLLGYTRIETGEIEFKCGGTLINSRYMLTAAHCIRIKRRAGLSLDIVRLGEWKISTSEDCVDGLVNEECADPILDLKIEIQIPHLGYSKKTGNNDIGLLRLDKNVKYTDYVRPICLPTLDDLAPNIGTHMVLAGWGSTENGSQSDIKLKLQVPVVDHGRCAEKIEGVGKVTENQLCAGGEKGKDACQGDSGGPLMGTYGTKAEKAQWYQEGIISYGIGCGRKEFPGIYTRVAKYMDWILDNISDSDF